MGWLFEEVVVVLLGYPLVGLTGNVLTKPVGDYLMLDEVATWKKYVALLVVGVLAWELMRRGYT